MLTSIPPSISVLSIVPLIIYRVTTPLEDQTRGGIVGVYVANIILMIVSQSFWIKMALCTPPGEAILLDKKEKQQMKPEYKSYDEGHYDKEKSEYEC